MIRYLLSLLPRCGVVGRRGRACTRHWLHRGRHKYEPAAKAVGPSNISITGNTYKPQAKSETELLLIASIEQAKERNG